MDAGSAKRHVAVELGAAAAVFGAVAASILPVYASGDGSQSLAAVNGDWVFVGLAAFLLAGVAPAILRRRARRWLPFGCGLMLLLGSFVTVVGIFFIPSGLALLTASAAPGPAATR